METIYKERIESILDKLAGNVEDKKSDIDKNKIIEHESYLNALLDYIISDLRRFRKEQADDSIGAISERHAMVWHDHTKPLALPPFPTALPIYPQSAVRI